MKRQITTLLTLSLLASLSACSKPASNAVTKSDEAVDAFQTKSIARVGLTKQLALTFDDGPSAQHTTRLLDILEDEGIKATFFLNGRNVPGNESVVKRMHDDGHVIANHSEHHKDLKDVVVEKGMRAVFNEIMDTHKAIQPFLQPGGRLYFRAPFGSWRDVSASYLNADQVLRDYIGPVFWDIGGAITRNMDKTSPDYKKIILDKNGNPLTAADWECWSINKVTRKPNLTVDQCLAGYYAESLKRNGGIVLLHDITAQSVDMTAKLIKLWKKAGFSFVTLDEVQALDQYAHQIQ